MDFDTRKTYCELCLNELDENEVYEGYTFCCNELAVNGKTAKKIYEQYPEQYL